MSGKGTRGTWRPGIGRLLTTIAWALLVILIASRVNRPTRIHLLDQPPLLESQFLSQVQIDTTSLPAAVASVNRPSGGKINFDPAGFSVDELEPLIPPFPPPHALHNVHLGTALAIATKPWSGYGGHLFWCDQDGQLMVWGVEPPSQQQAVTRIYDVHDILGSANAWWRRQPRFALKSSRSQTGLFGMQTSGRQRTICFPASPSPATGYVEGDLEADNIAMVIKEVPGSTDWSDSTLNWYAEGWGGWVLVRASPQAHRDVEMLLMLLRRGESEAALQIGPQP